MFWVEHVLVKDAAANEEATKITDFVRVWLGVMAKKSNG